MKRLQPTWYLKPILFFFYFLFLCCKWFSKLDASRQLDVASRRPPQKSRIGGLALWMTDLRMDCCESVWMNASAVEIAQLIRASMGFIFNWFISISFYWICAAFATPLWHEQLSRLAAGWGHMLWGVNEISNLRVCVSQNRLISNDNCCCDKFCLPL